MTRKDSCYMVEAGLKRLKNKIELASEAEQDGEVESNTEAGREIWKRKDKERNKDKEIETR